MIFCCDEEMLIAGRWHHCRKCDKRLVEYPHGKDRIVLAELIVSYVQNYDPLWREFEPIFHELWRAGYYEDYEPKLPKNWIGV